MRNLRSLLMAVLLATLALAQADAHVQAQAGPQEAPPKEWKGPVLKVGEGLAISFAEGPVQVYGEASKESPMGGLASLVWMRLEGAEWSSRSVRFQCKGVADSVVCSNPKGHGRVELRKALAENCHLAFLTWLREAQVGWNQDYGEAAARSRVEEVFSPFLGRRLPPGETLPLLSPAWVGEGDLLRTSPETFLIWLMEPDKGEVVTFGKRFLSGFWVEMKELFGTEGWWFKTGMASAPGDPSATRAWVAGGRGSTLLVLRLPKGASKEEALARVREILGLKP